MVFNFCSQLGQIFSQSVRRDADHVFPSMDIVHSDLVTAGGAHTISGAITSDTGQSVLDRVFGSGSSDDPAGFTSTGFNTAGGFDLTGSSASLRTAGSLAGF